jgi:hypothetical protein
MLLLMIYLSDQDHDSNYYLTRDHALAHDHDLFLAHALVHAHEFIL